MQELKKKHEKDRKEREEEVFNFAAKYDERMCGDTKTRATVPRPFQLSGAQSVRQSITIMGE